MKTLDSLIDIFSVRDYNKFLKPRLYKFKSWGFTRGRKSINIWYNDGSRTTIYPKYSGL